MMLHTKYQDSMPYGFRQEDFFVFFPILAFLNINNVYFDNMVSQIYPSELQLNKAAFLDLHLSISNDNVSTKIYDKRGNFDFEIVNFPFLDGDGPRSTSYGVFFSNSFVLLEHLALLLTSTLAINC